jgi:hypothetical protein
VINSSKVQLGITRQHAEVGLKNIIIFLLQKSLRQIRHKWTIIHIKDLHHNFVQFLAQELDITSHTTYPKIRYRGLVDFEIS